MSSIGDQIRFWRTARGITQQKLAERAGMHTVQISNLERGAANPQLDTLEKVAGALGARVVVTFALPDGKLEIERWCV
jgi:transcriptional regulator with XRE-family HTH domain